MSSPPPSSTRVGLGAASGYDEEIYGRPSSPLLTSIDPSDLDVDDLPHPSSSQRKRDREATVDEEKEGADPFDAYRKSRVSDRDNEYRARRLQRVLSPTRVDPFAQGGKGADGDARTYQDVMAERRLAQEEAAVLRAIEKKRREEADAQAMGKGAGEERKDDTPAQPKKKRRWDSETSDTSILPPLKTDERKDPGPSIAEDEDREPLDWDSTSLLKQKTTAANAKGDEETEDVDNTAPVGCHSQEESQSMGRHPHCRVPPGRRHVGCHP